MLPAGSLVQGPREQGPVRGYLYWEVGDLAASNIFFRPSIPDMASTFFLQSPTSTGRSWGQATRRSETGPALAMGGLAGRRALRGSGAPRARPAPSDLRLGGGLSSAPRLCMPVCGDSDGLLSA